ncbi:sugar transporter [Rhizoctonia solani AG-1 IA]|uniref:Sugar transporter n=1 Tax=Thanatephorus cucumeris (strain AG1-IA) TaxID=983506 RepID=L8WQV0_THACA|nr:sugar transporter [Rhizoctonia solani AG-1 IA]
MGYRLNSWFYCISAAMTMILYGFDASTFNAVQGYAEWKEYFHHPNPNVIGSVTTAYTVAAIVGGFFVSPWMSDTFGRRMNIIFGSVLVIAATCLQTFAPRVIGAFIAGRGIIGFAQGVALPAAATYISEVAPTEIRVCGPLVPTENQSDSYMCAHSAPIALLATMPFAPESPRWLVQHDKIDQARACLQKVRAESEVESELLAIREAIAFEKQQMSGVSYALFFTEPSIRWRFFLACVINFGQQATGQGEFRFSVSDVRSWLTSNLIQALNATMGILFTLNATWMVERFGRRQILIGGALGQPYRGTNRLRRSQTPTTATGGKSMGVAVAIVILLFSFILFYKPSWGATSMKVRATGVAMATQTQNVANAILQQAFPVFLEKAKWYTFFFFMGFNLFLAVLKLHPPIQLFGGQNHREAGERMEQNGVMEAVEKGDMSARPKYDADDRSGSSEKESAQHLEQRA